MARLIERFDITSIAHARLNGSALDMFNDAQSIHAVQANDKLAALAGDYHAKAKAQGSGCNLAWSKGGKELYTDHMAARSRVMVELKRSLVQILRTIERGK